MEYCNGLVQSNSFLEVITNLAFAGNREVINASKLAILMVSLSAGLIGFLWLNALGEVTNE